jgi:sugar phosphate isomerase/epimerase
MKIGLFTTVLGALTVGDMIAKVKALGHIEALELGTGGWPGDAHVDLGALADPSRARQYRQMIADAGLSISALSCHGNPLHPDAAQALEADKIFRRSVRLAERLDVPVVITFSGCPGDGDGARHPNWITTPWPPEYLDVLEWQWAEKAVPYWTGAARFAADHGVRVALEPHPGFLVYNPETALRLRAAAGDAIGVNFDPSHMYWQGIDVPTAIGALGPAIFHVHAKDVLLDRANISTNGVLDAKSYRRMGARSWLFRSVGWGHDEGEWKRTISALRLAGYDSVLSIEHEDALLSIDEGLQQAVTFLSRLVPTEPPAEPWWT